jgi:hypothetical protein
MLRGLFNNPSSVLKINNYLKHESATDISDALSAAQDDDHAATAYRKDRILKLSRLSDRDPQAERRPRMRKARRAFRCRGSPLNIRSNPGKQRPHLQVFGTIRVLVSPLESGTCAQVFELGRLDTPMTTATGLLRSWPRRWGRSSDGCISLVVAPLLRPADGRTSSGTATRRSEGAVSLRGGRFICGLSTAVRCARSPRS